jgi:hypothetical protein
MSQLLYGSDGSAMLLTDDDEAALKELGFSVSVGAYFLYTWDGRCIEYDPAPLLLTYRGAAGAPD